MAWFNYVNLPAAFHGKVPGLDALPKDNSRGSKAYRYYNELDGQHWHTTPSPVQHHINTET